MKRGKIENKKGGSRENIDKEKNWQYVTKVGKNGEEQRLNNERRSI